MHSVLVVGAGPVGLVMAAELARHGVPCRIIDALPQPSPYCRALGVTTRTLEVWEDMGILRDTMDAGIWISGRRVTIAGRPAQTYREDLSQFPYAHTSLSIPQPLTESILTRHLASFGISVERGVTLTSLTQDDKTVCVRLESADGKTEETQFRYVVGCDGAHSFVRQAAGIDFEGEMMPFEFMLGDVQMDWQLPRGYAFQSIQPATHAAPEFFVAIPLPEPNRYRVSMLAPTDSTPDRAGTDHGIQSERAAPGLELLQAKADQLVGEPIRLSDLRWSSIFRISMRLARSYQAGRVFLAGDAAHIHPPTGGQGMNTGIQDAYNLAWKLALVLRGKSPMSLLESYTMERRQEAENVIERSVRASMNTGAAGFKTDKLADTQLTVSYRHSPWVEPVSDANWSSALQPGDRAPDCPGLRRQGVGYPFRLFDVLRGTAHVLLLNLPEPTQGSLDDLHALAARLRDEFGEDLGLYLRIVVISPQAEGISYFPQITWVYDPDGSFAPTYSSPNESSWLIRPDGYISWCGTGLNNNHLFFYLQKLFATH
ncbi:2-polyprenyl-6-methoxyphenol hydroxylase-like FAD-dependent oxidoreductase [Larkinella arboricola]|uniref:2-polyprenyl-6-methoxyphenol hydroxylase-like FAD-dependent oxidoreductase n=1 Tax=Larkinella arboricola TaxID=643671 RepID=A0A327WQX0_LARAB|nr:FAD-dependent monooxygenase [Larkinella arboricola]RAJ93242.1 2-polyprenyl-6-methoxyphenol hydroxylase-like FAD-dependent oxidoreductase [Larkinella arboricola]